MKPRLTILGTLASGGMGTVYLARMGGSAGFSRLVAIKRLHPELAVHREFVAMLVDEARLASQIRHGNVIDTLDLVASDGAFSLVLEYVEGASLAALIEAAAARHRSSGAPIPAPIALAIMQGVLRGLHAAHEARGADGQPLGIIHRDVSPQNVLVGVDGVPRVIDFGIAKAVARMTATRAGEVRGKLAYMAPEQLLERPVTRQADVYAAGVMLWELLTGQRLFGAEDQRVIAAAVLTGEIPPPSKVNPAVPRELDAIVLKATARDVSDRWLTARDLGAALAPFRPASADEVGAWVRELAAADLAKVRALLSSVEPEASRTTDDLMQELARSKSVPPPPARRVGRGIVTASEGMEVSAPRPPEPRRLWPLAVGLAVLAAVSLLLGLSWRADAPRPARAASATAALEAPSISAPEAAPEAAPEPTSVLEATSAILPVAPVVSARLVASARPERARSTPPPKHRHHPPRKRPKRPGPVSADPLQYR